MLRKISGLMSHGSPYLPHAKESQGQTSGAARLRIATGEHVAITLSSVSHSRNTRWCTCQKSMPSASCACTRHLHLAAWAFGKMSRHPSQSKGYRGPRLAQFSLSGPVTPPTSSCLRGPSWKVGATGTYRTTQVHSFSFKLKSSGCTGCT